MFTTYDLYLIGGLYFIFGILVASGYFMSRKPKRDSRGRFKK